MKRKLDAPSKLLIVSIVALVMSVVAQIIILLPVYSLVSDAGLSGNEIDSKLDSALIWSRITRAVLYLAMIGVVASLILLIAKARRSKNGKAV